MSLWERWTYFGWCEAGGGVGPRISSAQLAIGMTPSIDPGLAAGESRSSNMKSSISDRVGS